jgi:N-acetylneuraminic acid mutarotase
MKKSEYWKYCLTIVSLVLVSIQIQAQNGWTHITDMPTPRVGASACVFDNKIYVMGGMITGYLDVANNEVYDPSENTWDIRKASMPTARSYLLTAVVNDTIYAIGGGYPTSTKKVEAYDPATNTWTTKKDMPYPWISALGGTVNGKIYVMGGNWNQRNCFEYDPSSNEWKEKTSIPAGRCAGALSAIVYNGLVYTFGGTTSYPFYGTTNPSEPLSTVDVYNPQTDTWDTTKMDMPTPRYNLRTFLVNEKIYAIGGTQARGTTLSTVEVYAPLSDTWESKPNMPKNLAWFADAVVNNKIYVIGGSPDWVSGTGEVWEYDPAFVVSVEPVPFTGITSYQLEQNYQNPFNPSTKISWQLLVGSQATLKVYDVLGKEVATLVNEYRQGGKYETEFNAEALPSGVYFCRLQAGSFVQTRKMILLK